MAERSMRATFNNRIEKADEFLEEICRYVSTGSLVTYCEDNNLSFSDVGAWLRLHKDRSEAFSASTKNRLEYATEKVIRELERIGMIDIRQIYKDNGDLKPVNEWPDDVGAAIESISTTFNAKGVPTVKVKLNNKIKALELMGKNMGIFVDLVHHSGKLSLEELVDASRGDGPAKDVTSTLEIEGVTSRGVNENKN